MAVSSRVRKALLVTHVSISVGWLGAVLAFLAVAITSATAAEPGLAHACSLAMQVIGWSILVPLSLASLLTGILQSLATPWGLFRHYWVLAKLVITIVATAILLMYMQSINLLAAAPGAQPASPGGGHGELQGWSPVIHSAGAIILLLLAVLLSIYKPRGMTSFGQRKQGMLESATGRDHS